MFSLRFGCLTFVLVALALRPAAALDAGAASCDITPDVQALRVPLAGYGARLGRPSTGVHDPIHAKVLWLRDGDRRMALITSDLRSVTKELKESILQKSDGLGLSADSLLVCASHSHSGPSLFPEKFWQTQFGAHDPKIVDAMSDAIAAGLKRAAASAAPASAGFAQATLEGFTRNRRWEYDTAAREASGEKPAVDPILTVVRFDAEGGKPIALLVNFATHPTILGSENMLVSAEWPGAMQDALQAAFPGAVALFANGAEGDQSPGAAKGADDFARAAEFGSRLAAEAEKLARAIKPEPGLPIGFARQTPELPPIRFSDAARQGPFKLMEKSALEALPRRAEIQILRVGPVALAGLPGEPICEVGRDVRRRLAALGFACPLVVGLANDYIGYILNEKEYAHGGYEVDSRSFYGPGLGAFIAESTESAARALPK